MPLPILSRNVLQATAPAKTGGRGLFHSICRFLTPWRNAAPAALALLLAAASSTATAGPPPLAPFKDDLFAYPALTAYGSLGDIDVDYSEARDIDARDEVPERRVKSRYIDNEPLATQREEAIDTPQGPLKIMSVGNGASPRAIVVFIHGRNGDRRLGMNDRTFGGNFNRLKNLMQRSGGLYVTADAGTFSATDAGRIEALLAALKARHGSAALVLACASMGGGLCWQVAADPRAMGDIDALVMLGASGDAGKVAAMRQAAGARRVPLVVAHGTRDAVFDFEAEKAMVAAVRSGTPDYPVRFIAMDGGTHGTPIRMIDWREALNWIFERLP